MNPITSFVHVVTHNHKESLNDCPHRYAHQGEKTKKSRKNALAVGFPFDVWRTNESFRCPTTKGRRIEEKAGEGPPSAASLHLYSRVCEVGIEGYFHE